MEQNLPETNQNNETNLPASLRELRSTAFYLFKQIKELTAAERSALKAVGFFGINRKHSNKNSWELICALNRLDLMLGSGSLTMDEFQEIREV